MTDWDLRPARDFGLPLATRLRSHRRESGLLGVLAAGLWRGAVRLYLRAAHRLEITGREHLPARPPFILVCNHASHLDALSLHAALPGPLARRTVALAAGDTFFGSLPGAAFAATALNALPIWRKGTSRDDLAFLRQRLEEDELGFILFPEGTRSRDGRMGRFRPGVGAFVAGSEVPVVPCFLQGAFRCWPAIRRLPRPGKLRLRIGPPLRFAGTPDDRTGWAAVAAQAEAAVRALSG